MKIERIEELLKEFNKLPKKSWDDPTFLEICSYPKRRFEEICSRILSFYFNPNKEHGLKDLFLNSIFEVIGNPDIKYQLEQIKVINEDNAEGKRIDLLIKSPDFVIGIENKITASLYNPLDIYKKRIEEHHSTKSFKLVLSLNKITKRDELDLINRNDFIAITYTDLFEVVKRNIGEYISRSNQKYITHLFDFIQTIENMKAANPIDQKISEFFFEKSKEIDELVRDYNNYKEHILNIQRQKITDINELISQRTNRKWWAWQGWDLGFSEFISSKPRIGIESSFKETANNPLGVFRIFITTWNLRDWQPYEKQLVEMFPDKYLDKGNGRVYLHVEVLEGSDEELIVEKLKLYFDILDGLTRD